MRFILIMENKKAFRSIIKFDLFEFINESHIFDRFATLNVKNLYIESLTYKEPSLLHATRYCEFISMSKERTEAFVSYDPKRYPVYDYQRFILFSAEPEKNKSPSWLKRTIVTGRSWPLRTRGRIFQC